MYWTNFLDELSPLREVSRLQRDLNRLFNEYNVGSQRTFPAVNIWANENSAVVTAELPGLENKDIKLSVVDQNVVIEGVRCEEPLKEGENFHRQERKCGDFKRTIQLPFPVNADKVAANFKNGVLKVTLPRAEADKPKKITIHA